MLVQQIQPQLVRPPVAVGSADAGGVVEGAFAFFTHLGLSLAVVCHADNSVCERIPLCSVSLSRSPTLSGGALIYCSLFFIGLFIVSVIRLRKDESCPSSLTIYLCRPGAGPFSGTSHRIVARDLFILSSVSQSQTTKFALHHGDHGYSCVGEVLIRFCDQGTNNMNNRRFWRFLSQLARAWKGGEVDLRRGSSGATGAMGERRGEGSCRWSGAARTIKNRRLAGSGMHHRG